MEILLSISILSLAGVLAVSVWKGKPFRIEVTHVVVNTQTTATIAEDKDNDPRDIRMEVAQAIQEAWGGIEHDDSRTEGVS